ncbi:pentapeptide repeat-containing protein [Streptomyces sp. NPDC050535]|uniref:pentapeptide repeat-containing protein n=1 Tax=Streptomyces sp. NPDC050535 TaxID=3365626 RepID=UPI003792FEE6
MSGTDLRGANLSGADPTNADLVHVMWSEETGWPVAVAAAMRERSVPIGCGRYRVQGSGNSGADLSVPPVPVSWLPGRTVRRRAYSLATGPSARTDQCPGLVQCADERHRSPQYAHPA